MQIEELLARFVCELQPTDVPASAERVLRQMVMAVVGTGIAGADEDGIAALRDLLRDAGGTPQATMLVFGDRLPAHAAAQFNATMCRALDYCDAMAPGPHIGSALFPAALAAAELAGGCTGAEFMAALAAGAELSSRLNLGEAQYDGFDPTGIAVPFAAAAAASRILRLTAQQTLHALALVVQPLRRKFPEPRRRLARRALRPGLGGRGRRAMRAPGAARRDRPGEFSGRALRLPPPLRSRHAGHRGDRREPRPGVAAAAHRLQEVPELRRDPGLTELALTLVADGLQAENVRSVAVRLPPYAYRLVGKRVRSRAQSPCRCAVQRLLLRRQRPRAPHVTARSTSRRLRSSIRPCGR